MGGLLTSCQSEEVREQLSKNKAIEKQLTSDRRAASSIIKLLLLGAGECGKSTVLKQMQILHSNGFTEEEINERKAVVYSNTVTSMAAILKAMDNVLHMPMDDASKERDRNLIFRAIENGEENLPFTDPIAKALQNLWGDKATMLKQLFLLLQ
uniref:G-protein alpha subunit n=1 Tax=Meloidogyne floridensis TaxID=298350 RepID=A0A915NDL8_9BILA